MISYSAVDPDEWIGHLFSGVNVPYLQSRCDNAYRFLANIVHLDSFDDMEFVSTLPWPLLTTSIEDPLKLNVVTRNRLVVQIAHDGFQSLLETYLLNTTSPSQEYVNLRVIHHMNNILQENDLSIEMDTTDKFKQCYSFYLKQILTEMEVYPIFNNSLLKQKIANTML